MAITLDVITRVTEASLRGTSRQIQQNITQTGKQSGEGFAKGFEQGVQANAGAIQKAVDKVADNLGQIKVAQQKINELQEKGAARSQLIAQQEKLNKLLREQNRLANDATSLYKRTANEVRNGFDVVNRGASGVLNVISNITAGTRFGGITSGIANMASGFTEAGVAVGGMSASMTAAAGIAGGVLVVGLAAAAAGAVALTKELYDLGSEWDNTFDNIIVKTGATGDVLEQIKASVKGVAGEVPASLDVIGDAAAGVAQNLKLVGPEAEDIIKSLARLKSYNIDVDIHTLGQAFRALNVEQENYQATLEKFLNLSQQTGVPIDSITSAVEDNAGALQAFGFTVDEVIGLMTKFQAEGIDPDKGIGALGRAFKALTDAGLEPTKANLQLVFDEIKGFASSGQADRANEEINKLFGARGGGLSWLPLITDGSLSLEELANGGEATRTSIEGMGDATDDLAEQWMMFKQDTKAALEPLASEVFKFANEALGSITSWLKDSKPEIIGFFTFASTQVVNFAQLIVESIGFAFYQIGTLGEKIPFIGGKFKGLKDAGQDLLRFGDKLGDLQTRLQTVGDLANARAENAREFSKEMNNNLKILEDGQTVVLKDNSQEFLDNIDKTKYAVENLPDGQVKVVPLTDEATQEMQDWVDEQNGVPLEPEVKPDTEGADKFLEDWRKALEGKPIDIPVTTDPFNPGGVLGPGIPTPGGPRKFAASGAGGYGMPANANSGGYGGGGTQFPGWVYDIAQRFGIKPSTYPGHQTSDRNEPGYAPNPRGENRGIDWTGPVENLQRFADYLSTIPQELEQVIWQNPYTGRKTGIGGGVINPGYYPQSTYDSHGGNDPNNIHVHTRQSSPIPVPGMRRFGPGGTVALSSATDSAGMLNYGPDDTSPLPPGTPSPIAGLDPGPVGSTFGYNEYGEPGYYRPDSKSIASAERAADKAEERVTKAQERIDKINDEIAAKEAERTVLNSQKTDAEIAALRDQLKTANESKTDAEEQRDLANQNLTEARQGRFTEARESKRGKTGGMGQIGADLEDDFGISGGLPGMAEWLTKFLANLAFAPMLGQLSAISAASPYQGGYGMLGVGGAQAMAANGGSLFPQGMMPGQPPFGVPAAATTPVAPGVPPTTIGPAPLGGGVGSPHLTGATPGPTVTPNTSQAPSAGPGGGGFTGVGGLPLAAMQLAGAGADLLAPGMGQAAQTGIELANRAIGYAGQVAGIGVGGLMETLLPNNSPLADPAKSWVGRIAAGFAGARPALPNQAGGAGEPARAQTPQEAAALQQQNGGGQGPLVNIENMVNQTPDGGQQVANQIGRHQAVAYASGGPR